jgi:hypothetical protein
MCLFVSYFLILSDGSAEDGWGIAFLSFIRENKITLKFKEENT